MTRIWKTRALGYLMLGAAAGAFAGGTWQSDDDGSYRIPGIGRFEGVVNASPATVVIRIGAQNSVRAVGDGSVLRHFRFDVQDGRLRIRNPWRPWYLLSSVRDREIRVEVTMPELHSVTVTGSGNVTVEDPIRGGSLFLRTTGAGRISANGDADLIEIEVTGSGDISFAGSCDEADLAVSGSGDLLTTLAAQAITARITGAGDIHIGGSAREIQLRLGGAGQFSGNNFTANSADITINGSGDAILAVERELKARLTGSGELRLAGGTPEIDARTTGSGRIIRSE